MPQKRSATRFDPPMASMTSPLISNSAASAACTNAPGGGTASTPPKESAGARARNSLAVDSNARKTVFCGDPAETCNCLRTDAVCAVVDGYVQSAACQQHRQPRCRPRHHGRNGSERRQPSHDGWHQDGALLDVDELVALAAVIAERRGAVLPAPRGQHRAPSRRPAIGAGGVQRPLEPVLAKSIDDDAALPLRIERVAHVLRDAAAAYAEVAAERRRAIRLAAETTSASRCPRGAPVLRAAQMARSRGPPAVSAMPSPWAPRRTISSSIVTVTS